MRTVMFNLKALKKNRTMRYGVPMLCLIIGGSFGLREFTQIRYDVQRLKRKLDPSLEAKVDVQRQSTMLEDEYEKMKEVNMDDWKNVRGPRPWENSREYQEQQRSKQDKKD